MRPGRPRSIARRFAWIALPVVFTSAAILFVAYRQVSVANLRVANEASAAALTSVFANSLWPHVADFAKTAHTFPADTLRHHPLTRFLMSEVRDLTAGSHVQRLKLHDRNGFTVFSTEPRQIGRRHGDMPGFRAALAGGIASELTRRDRFAGLHGTLRNAEIFAAYLPVTGEEGAPVAVLEIYIDVTPQYLAATGGRVTVIAVGLIALILFGAFGIQLLLVRRAERMADSERENRLRLERGIDRAESASRAKSEFLANMGHELRTPLNAIMGFSELIQQQRLGPVGVDRYSDYAADIRTAAARLLELVNDVLAFSQAEAGRMEVSIEPVDAAAALGAVVNRFRAAAERKTQTLLCEMPPDLPPLRTDRDKLETICANLLSNAVKFTPDGGSITAALTLASGSDTLVLEVADTGIGMRAEEIPIALSPFGQVDSGLNRSYEGAGLGLSLAARLVALLGGIMRIDSAAGRGTRVRVSLPLAAGRPAFRAA